jgi:hypothetical protein
LTFIYYELFEFKYRWVLGFVKSGTKKKNILTTSISTPAVSRLISEEKSNEVSSPVLNNTQSRLSLGPTPMLAYNKSNITSLNRKAKSHLPSSCSTPKLEIAKEIEFLNTLYSTGAFENTQRLISNPAEGSPIIGSANALRKTAPALFNKDVNFEHTPMVDSTISLINHTTPVLDNINRNLKFEEEIIEKERRTSIASKKPSKLVMVEEDDELLAHMNEIDSKNNLTLNSDVSQKKYFEKFDFQIKAN